MGKLVWVFLTPDLPKNGGMACKSWVNVEIKAPLGCATSPLDIPLPQLMLFLGLLQSWLDRFICLLTSSGQVIFQGLAIETKLQNHRTGKTFEKKTKKQRTTQPSLWKRKRTTRAIHSDQRPHQKVNLPQVQATRAELSTRTRFGETPFWTARTVWIWRGFGSGFYFLLFFFKKHFRGAV